MSKIVVDVMPKTSTECPFAEEWVMTGRNKCSLQQGVYSRCNLECNMECDKLIALNTEGANEKILGIQSEYLRERASSLTLPTRE